jgi:hypothetical protein
MISHDGAFSVQVGIPIEFDFGFQASSFSETCRPTSSPRVAELTENIYSWVEWLNPTVNVLCVPPNRDSLSIYQHHFKPDLGAPGRAAEGCQEWR